MDADAVWIFAYGSLLWDPGFVPAEAAAARLAGFRRSFCMWSIHFRGTPEAPGLVLALHPDEAGACNGLALRLPAPEAEAILAAIRARELISDAYEERRLPLALADGRAVEALAYVIRPGHPQHAALDPGAQAATIARARARAGRTATTSCGRPSGCASSASTTPRSRRFARA